MPYPRAGAGAGSQAPGSSPPSSGSNWGADLNRARVNRELDRVNRRNSNERYTNFHDLDYGKNKNFPPLQTFPATPPNKFGKRKVKPLPNKALTRMGRQAMKKALPLPASLAILNLLELMPLARPSLNTAGWTLATNCGGISSEHIFASNNASCITQGWLENLWGKIGWNGGTIWYFSIGGLPINIADQGPQRIWQAPLYQRWTRSSVTNPGLPTRPRFTVRDLGLAPWYTLNQKGHQPLIWGPDPRALPWKAIPYNALNRPQPINPPIERLPSGGKREQPGAEKNPRAIPDPAPGLPPIKIPVVEFPIDIDDLPSPIGKPKPGTRPGEKPGPRPKPRPGQKADPTPEPGPQKPGVHVYRPAYRTERERKRQVAGPASSSILGWTISTVTESLDFLEAFYKSLPRDLRNKLFRDNGFKPLDPLDMLGAVAENWESIDKAQAAYNLAFNALQDFVIGKFSALGPQARRKVYEAFGGDLYRPELGASNQRWNANIGYVDSGPQITDVFERWLMENYFRPAVQLAFGRNQ